MYRYKLMGKKFFGFKSPVLTNRQKIEALENTGMIDLMTHQWDRFKAVNPLHINTHALWEKWIRR